MDEIFTAKKCHLMRELWKLAKQAETQGDKREAKMLTIAGNVVENTFCIGEIDDLLLYAIEDDNGY